MCFTGINFFARKPPKNNYCAVVLNKAEWSEKVIKEEFDRI